VRRVDRDEYRQESLKTWDELAETWDATRDEMAAAVSHVGDFLVEWLDAQPGETMLDIAAGNGGLSHALSPLVGESGRVICTDFAPNMVKTARRRGEQLGLSSVEYRVMDAERMDLDDASVDGAVCRFGYMLMADHARALKETRRVLRDGGRLTFAVWGEPMKNAWVLVPGSVLMERGHMQMPGPDEPGIFALGGVDKIEAALSAAGLEPRSITELPVHYRYPDADTMWHRIATTMGPLARVISQLPADDQNSVRDAILERAEPFRDGDSGGYDIPGMAMAVHALPAA
jgi:ubiquinone/menaquinone biosynthesis C-methylase UbiE